MKTLTINVYEFSELDDKAKKRAIYDAQASFGFTFDGEYMASIEKLVEHFDGKMSDWSIDWFNCSASYATFDMPEMTSKEIKSRLAMLGSYNKKTLCGNGECKLTGYCGDENAIDGFRKAFLGGENDLTKLMQAAFNTWLKAAQEDCAGQYSDEIFSENSDANNYHYKQNGELA